MTSLIILVWKVAAFAAVGSILGVAALTFVSAGAESAEHGQQGHVGTAGDTRIIIAAPMEITARYPMPVLSMVVVDD